MHYLFENSGYYCPDRQTSGNVLRVNNVSKTILEDVLRFLNIQLELLDGYYLVLHISCFFFNLIAISTPSKIILGMLNYLHLGVYRIKHPFHPHTHAKNNLRNVCLIIISFSKTLCADNLYISYNSNNVYIFSFLC